MGVTESPSEDDEAALRKPPKRGGRNEKNPVLLTMMSDQTLSNNGVGKHNLAAFNNGGHS